MQKFLLLHLALAAVALAGCQRVAEPVEAQPPLVKVRLVEEDAKFAQKLELVGSVMPWRVSRVASAVKGKVAAFPLREGDPVASSEPLVQLEEEAVSIQLAAAKALKNKAAEALKLSQTRAKRVRQLYSEGNVNQENLDEVESEARQAQYAFDHAAEEVTRLDDQLIKHRIKPPFHGPLVVLVQKHVDKGEGVEEAKPVAVVADLTQVEVNVAVEEKYLHLLRVGQRVDVRFDALADPVTGRHVSRPGQPDHGEVVHIVPKTNWSLGSRSFPVRIRIPNVADEQGQPLLKEGMLARLTITGAAHGVLKVHKDCIVRTSGQPVVFKIDQADERAYAIPVETGRIVGDFYEILAPKEGLRAGDRLAAEGAERLRAFQKAPRVEVLSDAGAKPASPQI